MTSTCLYISLWDSESRLLWANGFDNGHSQDSTIGRFAWDLSEDPVEQELVRNSFARTIAHGEICHYEVGTIGDPDIRYRCQLFPIPESTGGQVRVCVLATPTSGAALSRREFQVFQQLAQGLELKEIASNLGVSHSTIQTHSSTLQRKLKLDSLMKLVAYAARSMVGQITPTTPFIKKASEPLQSHP